MIRNLRHLPTCFLLIVLLPLAACQTLTPTPPPTSPAPPTQSNNLQSPISKSLNSLRVGWAYEAYPEASFAAMRADMERMAAAGANAIWIGHNNPGEVDANKIELGLSYAVFEALQDEDDPRHADAVAMANAVRRALDAARAARLQVILPVGYQIQMGSVWNEKHPDDLRRRADGSLLELYDSGYTASPYSESYRADISRYYEWIQREWVAPYREVIVMLSLADEPMGGDYSASARMEFAKRCGKPIKELRANERWQLGEFQAGVIVDYAVWSASEWKSINPGLLITMSFHGGETARRVWGLPDLERLFAETPDNFILTFDAYLHDDLASKPATADEAAQLKLLLSTLGHYSRVYQKPIALWGGANAWGLAQESTAPRDIPDAVTNLLLLYDLPRRAGGDVWGIFAWNYNVKRQGLYNYDLPTTYEPEALETAVNRTFPLLRSRHSDVTSVPEIAIYVPPRRLYDALARSQAAGEPPPWFDTTPYARAFADRQAVLTTTAHSLQSLADARWLIVVGSASELDPAVLELIRPRQDKGQIVIAEESLASTLGTASQAWTQGLTQLPEAGKAIYVLK